MNAIANVAQAERANAPALAMSEDELMSVLQSSIYPGASPASIKMVIGVCKASGKDPLKKPYHIVPMYVKGADGQSGMRDVIMPGINDYRTDASRTGQHAGTSEPEFGPDVTEKLSGTEITYPVWCRVTVSRRMPSGEIVNFTATERWKENYATAKRDTTAPNTMWRKRPYAQLAKCAEAQALRKGFPEVGSQPTADEMEGKEIGEYEVHDEPKRSPQRPKAIENKAKDPEPEKIEDAEFTEEPNQKGSATQKADAAKDQESDDANKLVSPGTINLIVQWAQKKDISKDHVLDQFRIRDIDGISESRAREILNWIRAQ